MTMPTALNTPHEPEQGSRWRLPDLEAPIFLMAYSVALAAVVNILGSAVSSLVAHLIASETHFGCAFVRVVARLAAKNTRRLFSLIRAFFSNMSELPTVVTFQSDIILSPIPRARLFLLLIQQILIA